jgi:hypothetical protein
MHENVTIKELMQEKICYFSRDILVVLTNFLLLEKINHLDKMPNISFSKYLKNRTLNSNLLNENDLLSTKEKMITDLVQKSLKLKNHGVFVLRSELSNLVNYFKDDSRIQRKLLEFIKQLK